MRLRVSSTKGAATGLAESQHCHFAFVAELFMCGPPVGGTFWFQIFIRKPCRRSGRLASSPAVEWRVYRGTVARLSAGWPEGDRACAPDAACGLSQDPGTASAPRTQGRAQQSAQEADGRAA